MNNEKQNKITQNANKYKSKEYKRIPLEYKLSDYEQLKSYCNAHNLKVNTFIKMCVDKCINEGFAPEQPEHKSYYNKANKECK